MSHKIHDKVEFVIGTGPILSDDFFSRAIAFYQKCLSDPYTTSIIWDAMRGERLNIVEDALKSKDVALVRAALEGAFASKATWGMDYDYSRYEEDEWKRVALVAANSLGVTPVFDPAQPSPQSILVQDLFAAMENVTGVRIAHSGVIGLASALVGTRLVPYKLIESVASCSSLMRHMEGQERIIEFGAGLGWLCYWLQNVRPAYEYHIVDLPIVSVMSAYCLASALGERRVCFKGESKMHFFKPIVLQGTHPELDSYTKFDVAVSTNAMPEMPPQDLHRYLLLISERLQTRGLFFSINQETDLGNQTRLFCEIQRYPKLRQLQRNPNWHRPGYVDEMWVKHEPS